MVQKTEKMEPVPQNVKIFSSAEMGKLTSERLVQLVLRMFQLVIVMEMEFLMCMIGALMSQRIKMVLKMRIDVQRYQLLAWIMKNAR